MAAGSQRRGRIILAIMALVVIASLWRAGSVENQKNRLAKEYEQAKAILGQLEAEHGSLSEELSVASRTMAGQALDISELREELALVQDQLDETVVELSALQRDHERVRQENASLVNQMESLQSEKVALEGRLSSLKELRVAIREVKQKMRDERWAAWRARAVAQRELDQQLLAKGNRGFVIREGTTTVGSGTPARLQVHVREPEAVP